MVKKIIAKSVIYLALLLMYLPILVLIIFSFTENINIGSWSGFSFGLYVKLFKNQEIMTAIGNTILVAVISSLVSTFLGTIGAIGIFYSGKKMKRTMDAIGEVSIVNSEIVTALSLTLLFVALSKIFHMNDIFGYGTLIIGHVVLTIPFVILNVTPKLEQMDPNTYEAALDLGATPRKALWNVVIPEILPGIFSGFLLCITLSLDDYVITAFTRDNSIETLSTLIESKTKKGYLPPELRALTTIIFLIMIAVVVIINLRKKTKKERKIN